MKKISEINSENSSMALRVFKGVGIGYILTILMFLIFAIVLSNTSFPDKMIPTAVVVTTMISILISGTLICKNVRDKGWVTGGLAGLIYMLILSIVSWIGGVGFTLYSLIMLVVGTLAGALGGIVGINLNRR